MWEISNIHQLINFGWSVVLGIIFCILYDVLRAFRKVISFSAISMFFQDIFFSLVLAFTTFTYLLSVTNGELRGFVFVGILAGFVLARMTFSIIFVRFLKWIIGLVYGLFSLVSSCFYATFDRLIENILKFCQKRAKHLKKLLKNACELLYTKEDRKV